MGINFGLGLLVVDEDTLGSVICYTGPGIYGSKRTESEGVARGQGLFTSP